ncbi:hypothetical protein CW713_11600 [Methanophagales archaeon]|nr:MAG: hypothetical protein CW714_08650 [Methanophagales archaeon]RJS76019.1 MAG: hypothetical protein CW713_11600 [Methanophagales archaeon]
MLEKEEEKGEKVPLAFLKIVNDFYKESDTVFKEFDTIRDHYSKGADIMEDLKGFRNKRPGIFGLIYDIFHKEVELEDKLERAGIEKEKRDKIFEFKERFSDLADEIDILVLGELGLGG